MTEGTVLEGLFNGGDDLGFPEEVDESRYIFELLVDVEFRFSHIFQILLC